jgi:protein TonB
MKNLISLSILSACMVACQPSKTPEQKQTASDTTAEDSSRIDSIVLKTAVCPPPPPETKFTPIQSLAPMLDVNDMPVQENLDYNVEPRDAQIGSIKMEHDNVTDNPSFSYSNVELKPEFIYKGGLDAYIKENLNYPVAASVDGIEGTCIISFTISTDGQIIFAGIAKSSGYRELDYEALRIIKKMPRWIPGIQNGQTVAVMHSIPVEFDLGE